MAMKGISKSLQENLLVSLTERSLSVLLDQLNRNTSENVIRRNDEIPEDLMVDKETPIDMRVWCPVMCRLDGECCLTGRIYVDEDWVLYRTNYIKSVGKDRRLVCDDDDNWFRLCGGLIPQTQDELYAQDDTIPLMLFDWKVVDAFSEGLPENFRLWIQQVAVASQCKRIRESDPEKKTDANGELDASAAATQSEESMDDNASLEETEVSESFADFDINEDPVKYVDRLLATNPYKDMFRDRMIDRVIWFRNKRLRQVSKTDPENVEPDKAVVEADPSESGNVEARTTKKCQSHGKPKRGRPKKKRSLEDQGSEESPPKISGRSTGRTKVKSPFRPPRVLLKRINPNSVQTPEASVKNAEGSEDESMAGVSVHDFSPQDPEWSPFQLKTIKGSSVDVRQLPRSRSGRIIKPILDKFRGQQIVIEDGKVVEIHHGKEDKMYNLKVFSTMKMKAQSKKRRQKSSPKPRIQPSSVHGSGKRRLFSVDKTPPLPTSSFNKNNVKAKNLKVSKSDNEVPTECYRKYIAKT